MIEHIFEHWRDGRLIVSSLVAVAVVATVLTMAMPLLHPDTLARRMKSVANERERIRVRERAAEINSKGLRQQPKAYMKKVVDRFSLATWLSTEDSKMKLASAGFRGPQSEVAFLFFRLVMPIAFLLLSLFYFFVLDSADRPLMIKIGVVIGATYVGIKAPEIFISNTIARRQQSMRMAFPNALDLLLICVESGMSIEHAFRKISQEISAQSPPLAEEFALATAELSYLPDRRTAYLNFAARTGLDAVKHISTVLIQAEKYGTPLGQALRVTAQESRDQRMIEAEKKAASLPPKLTVPMILFFLPVLMAVVMAPAIIQVMRSMM